MDRLSVRSAGQITERPRAKAVVCDLGRRGEAQQLTKTENDVNAFDWAGFGADCFFDDGPGAEDA